MAIFLIDELFPRLFRGGIGARGDKRDQTFPKMTFADEERMRELRWKELSARLGPMEVREFYDETPLNPPISWRPFLPKTPKIKRPKEDEYVTASNWQAAWQRRATVKRARECGLTLQASGDLVGVTRQRARQMDLQARRESARLSPMEKYYSPLKPIWDRREARKLLAVLSEMLG